MSEHSLQREDFAKLSREEKVPETVVRESISAWKDAWFRLRSNKMAMVSLVILFLIVVMAIIGQWISPHDYSTNDLSATNQKPSSDHWFGTDALGRDMFSRTWMGAGISLQVGIYAALVDLFVGVIIGGIMGYYGGKVDEVLNRFCEILYSIPSLLVVILLIVVLEPSMFTIILALSITGWINMAWIVRGQIMQLKNQEYVLAARSLGASPARIMFKHLVPNAIGAIIVTITMTVPSAIFAEAFLSFLGLGVQSPAASLGTLINDALKAMTIYPWRMIFPAVLISLTMLCFNIFGDGLRDALDPKMKK
ncbi:ABC transporter permease [Paenibacillus radicis (ex Gao et al. 2016)]|uniref:Oligopeptide transport system permease protein OppC n=1 Tax=Paenibacillus radicis (ex Gao et al. 2016) TaxID=1737354 RepID=A0A917HPF5_9BACL|nr:ABC transporter permease [Paenibacillus radicis (ex Gao et al. 2016)]GGG85101.1 oligopeptide transport system permease protein OppC [Paenibacillus radicis (ex Gao et al. 2016)]